MRSIGYSTKKITVLVLRESAIIQISAWLVAITFSAAIMYLLQVTYFESTGQLMELFNVSYLTTSVVLPLVGIIVSIIPFIIGTRKSDLVEAVLDKY